jgi:hypothetical protein
MTKKTTEKTFMEKLSHAPYQLTLHCIVFRTPNFDRFAAQGTKFNECHVLHTQCLMFMKNNDDDDDDDWWWWLVITMIGDDVMMMIGDDDWWWCDDDDMIWWLW